MAVQPHRSIRVERTGRVELRLEDQGRAVGQRGHERVGRPQRPEQRRGEEQPVIGPESLPLADLEPVLDEMTVGQGDAFRAGGRPGREQHQRDVVGGPRHVRLAGRGDRGPVGVADRPSRYLLADENDGTQAGQPRGAPAARRFTPELGNQLT